MLAEVMEIERRSIQVGHFIGIFVNVLFDVLDYPVVTLMKLNRPAMTENGK